MALPSERDKVILTGTIGSHSYGTATPTSDYDYMSFVLPEDQYLFGIREWGSSGTKEHEYDDPVKGFVEHKYFDIRKAISLCTNFNPNIIVMLWLQPEHYEVITPEGALLVQNRTLFNSKKMYHTFSGYAHGQLQKMGGVFNDNEEPNKLLRAGHVRFQEWAETEIAAERRKRDTKAVIDREMPGYEIVEEVNPGTNKWVPVIYDEGYLNALIALKTHSKEEIKRIKDGPITGRMGKKRKELREQYGYDTKFAFHTIRLMKMCVEFLKNPEEGLKVYRKGIDGDFLYSIRTGAFSQEDVKKMADDLFAEAKDVLKTSPLPDEPDYNGIQTLTMDLIRSSMQPTIFTCSSCGSPHSA
jgi:hypothetical protein